MTPTQEATRIFDQYLPLVRMADRYNQSDLYCNGLAIKCAIIDVQNTIKNNLTIDMGVYNDVLARELGNNLVFLEQMLPELEKL